VRPSHALSAHTHNYCQRLLRDRDRFFDCDRLLPDDEEDRLFFRERDLRLDGDFLLLEGDFLLLEGDRLFLEGDLLFFEGDLFFDGDRRLRDDDLFRLDDDLRLEGDFLLLESDFLFLEGDLLLEGDFLLLDGDFLFLMEGDLLLDGDRLFELRLRLLFPCSAPLVDASCGDCCANAAAAACMRRSRLLKDGPPRDGKAALKAVRPVFVSALRIVPDSSLEARASKTACSGAAGARSCASFAI